MAVIALILAWHFNAPWWIWAMVGMQFAGEAVYAFASREVKVINWPYGMNPLGDPAHVGRRPW